MISLLKNIYKKMRGLYHRMKFYYTVNWTKTLYFNFKKFPFAIAKKLPVFFYGKVHFQSIRGEIIINGPIKTAMIGYGQHFETSVKSKGIAEFSLYGKLIFNGYTHFGKDVILYIGENAHCEFGYMSCLGSDVKVVCTNKVIIGDWSGIGYESQIIDTNSHPMKNSETGEYYPMTGTIHIGTHNAFSNRISIMPNTKTPDFCVIASNTLCNKDYTSWGSNILIGGVPAKLLKNNYTRDWENEKELLVKYKVIEL
jgi:acetyltransferase-like isoleucine patch superfamily enzyme